MTPLLLSILLGTVAAAEGAREPADCKAYVVSSSAPQQRSVHKCGESIKPPAQDQYRVWLERPGQVSSGQALVLYVPDGHETPIRFDWLSAGSIRVSPIGGAASYRLVSLDQSRFEKRVLPDDVEQMPAGRVLAGAFDAAGNAIALSRPISVEEGRTAKVSLAGPAEGSDLLVVLSKRGPRPAVDQMPPVVADTGSGARKPDASVDLGDRVIAVWYGLRGASARLTVTSDSWNFAPVTLPLVEKRAATYRGPINAAN